MFICLFVCVVGVGVGVNGMCERSVNVIVSIVKFLLDDLPLYFDN